MFFYHISRDSFLEKKPMKPRVPKNRMNKEDSKTKRICASMSVSGALSAIPVFKKGDKVFVYELETDNFIQPTIEQVEDSPVTGEVWILEEVEPKLFGIIQIEDSVSYTSNGMEIVGYSYQFFAEYPSLKELSE